MPPKTIFNIFARKNPIVKKQEKTKEKIIVDYREKNCLVSSELIQQGFEIEFRELKVADYLVNGVAIERKTINDFISSMINRRLITQLEELSQYENRLLIVEGIDEQELYSDEKTTGMHPNAIRGFLLSILLKFKTPVIFTKNCEDTSKFIGVIARKKEKTSISLNAKKKALNKKEQLEFILEGFPGIGPKTSKKLLKKFSSIKSIINSNEEEIKSLLGKKSEAFLKLINEEY